jgi:hypothetical protein
MKQIKPRVSTRISEGNFEMKQYADLWLKHLELVQAVIARLADAGASHKNYCLTISTAILGLTVTLQRPVAFLIALLPVVVFSILDAQYLRTERSYRTLYDLLRAEDWNSSPDFNMTPISKPSFRSAFCSWSIAGFYGGLFFAVIFLTVTVGLCSGKLV